MISCMISWNTLSFSKSCDVNIMIFAMISSYKSYKNCHDIQNFWYQSCFSYDIASDVALYWHLISRTTDISAIWYHLFIWYHVICAVRLCWLGAPQARSSAGPHHCQQTGDMCPAELQQTWSCTWTCCSGCCKSKSACSCQEFKLPLLLETLCWSATLAVDLESETY